MRLLYCAIDQSVPGDLGGSVHVQSVAEGLTALGHDVTVAVGERRRVSNPGSETRLRNPGSKPGFVSVQLPPPFGRAELRWMRASALTDLARRTRAEVVIERYYNFGGEGVIAARRLGIPAVLEVNAPVIDYPGSTKARLDRALLFEPMRRWRDRLCRLTSLFVTPSRDILPHWIDPARVLEIEWGADVDKFRPDAAGPVPFERDPARTLCVFAGAFRSWHGVVQLAAALSRLHDAGDHRFGAVFIGDGPERPVAERAARGVPGITFTGAIPHDELPACLAAADIGVAPFDPARHAPLQLTFYWSPLKVFEYMAAGLPVVAPSIPRLAQLVTHEQEGLLYDPADPRALDRVLQRLADGQLRRRMGAAARARVVRDFSWEAHCRALDARLRALVAS